MTIHPSSICLFEMYIAALASCLEADGFQNSHLGPSSTVRCPAWLRFTSRPLLHFKLCWGFFNRVCFLHL